MLVGNTQTREPHPLDAGCSMVSLYKTPAYSMFT